MLFKRLIRYKVYLDRSRSYISYFNFVMMLMVSIKVYEDRLAWLFKYWWTLPVCIILVFGLLIVWGYVDKRFIRPHETSEINAANPEFMEMYAKLNEMYEKTMKP